MPVPLLEVTNLGKRYQMTYEKGALVQYLIPKFLRLQRFGDFWAVRNISFKLEPGQVLGVIGPNGSGKSTLLNLCSGITEPSEGSLVIGGKVVSLLTLGAGFHPDLSGEENIYLNGVILGLTIKGIRRKLDAIVKFSGLGHLIEAPLQTYSAGMTMRLGFAIAIQAPFDLLVIDEILTVGDGAFQQKCFAKLLEFKKQGKSLILTTHGLDTVESFCDRVLLLETGRDVAQGDPKEVVGFYRERMNGNGRRAWGLTLAEKKKLLLSLQGGGDEKERPRPTETHWIQGGWGKRFGVGKAEIKKVQLLNEENQPLKIINSGDYLRVRVEYEVKEKIRDPHFGVAIYRSDGVYCFGPNTRFDGIRIGSLEPGEGWFQIVYSSLSLLSGHFSLGVAIWDREEEHPYDFHRAMYPFRIRTVRPEYGIASLSHRWILSGVDQESQGNLMMGHSVFQREMEERIGSWLNGDQVTSMQGGVEVELLEVRGKGGSISTGETLLLKGVFKSDRPVSQLSVWFGIFRDDGILCYGTSSLADGVLFELEPGKTEWGVLFPRIPLLRGKFHVSLAWCDLRQQTWGMIPEVGFFEIKETLPHHGLVSIKRQWKGSPLGWKGLIGRRYG